MYFPPSQVITNLSTDGSTYETANDGISYSGFFWELKGKARYTGKTPESRNPGDQRLLIKIIGGKETGGGLREVNYFESSIPDNIIQPHGSISQYQFINDIKERRIPLAIKLELTEFQKKRRSIKRFFLKRNGSFEYMEVNGITFNSIAEKREYAWDLYSYAQLRWEINGEEFNVEKRNKDRVFSIERNINKISIYNEPWTGFSQYFNQNYLQYYQGVKENRTTTGGKYKTKNNKEYSGSYHIHPEKGPMVGATHVDTPHEYLYPINSKIPMDVTSSIQQSTPSQDQYNMSSSPNSTFQGGGSSGGGGY